jgi:phosphate acetyltransferase
MLSNKKIICPNNLLNVAKRSGLIDAAIVNAGEIFPMESIHMAVKHDLINPTFIGNQDNIKKYAKKLEWDISKYKIIDERNENSTAPIAAKLASENKVKIIVKGHIHTDILMKAVLKRDLNLIGKKRLSHVWHMTLDKDDKPFIITDGVVNVLPKLEVKMHILRNAVEFANKIGITKPKVSILSATEEVIESVPSSIDANIITKRAKEENINADVFGPLAFDNSVSKKSAAIKKIKNGVSGHADILLVPNVEAGNALVKMMIYFMGACAAGVVVGGKAPVVITSRSDEAESRLASIAAAIVALT